MSIRHSMFCVVSSAVVALSCGTSAEPTGHLALAVAPLELPGVADACYSLTVTNQAGQTVWTRGGICADRFGDNESAISYVGTCDASLVDGQPQTNTVTLSLEDLFDGDGNPIWQDTYQNPCGFLPGPDDGRPENYDGFGPCELRTPCIENADTPVEFNLTILRDARQGFLDLAVNFDDVFCSAKLDTCIDDVPIELLFDANGDRAATAVIAVACSGGPGADVDTHLYMNAIELVCPVAGVPTTIARLDPSVGTGGNVYDATGATGPAHAPGVYQYAIYEGNEQLDCDGDSCNKRYWNIAVGLDAAALAPGCRLVTTATAADGELAGGLTPAATTYPVIAIDVPVIDAGGVACSENPLDPFGEEVSGVDTTYTSVSDPVRFCYMYDGVASVPLDDPSEVAIGWDEFDDLILGEGTHEIAFVFGEGDEVGPDPDCGFYGPHPAQGFRIPFSKMSGGLQILGIEAVALDGGQVVADLGPAELEQIWVGGSARIVTRDHRSTAYSETGVYYPYFFGNEEQDPPFQPSNIGAQASAQSNDSYLVDLDQSEGRVYVEIRQRDPDNPVALPPVMRVTLRVVVFMYEPPPITEDCPDLQSGSGWPMPANAPGCALSGIDLTGADLTGAVLYGSDFSSATLVSVNFTNAQLSDVDMTNANLAGCSLFHADFSGATLTGVSWAGATCPDGTVVQDLVTSCVGHLTF